jgi:hypothetical protein
MDERWNVVIVHGKIFQNGGSALMAKRREAGSGDAPAAAAEQAGAAPPADDLRALQAAAAAYYETLAATARDLTRQAEAVCVETGRFAGHHPAGLVTTSFAAGFLLALLFWRR